jgi:hypothetical protein
LLSNNIKVKIHGTIILPIVLYGCETWSLILKEERRLRGIESRVLRKRVGLRGTRKVLRSLKLYGLYSSPNIIRVINKEE